MKAVAFSSVFALVGLGFLGCASAQGQTSSPAAAVAPQEGTVSAWEGVFSEAQAARGQATYESRCAACHGADLMATSEAPNLTGPGFTFGWQKKTVANRFETIKASMPPTGPRLADEMYVDIVAYIMKFNGYPTGERELPTDVAELSKIVIAPAP